jgi:uncharacterized membrane protein (DUF2068 family)
MVQRPVGISIIAVLAALVGVICFIGAVGLAALSTAGSAFEDLIETYGGTVMPFNIGSFITAALLALAGFAAIIGILYLVAAYGLWTGRGWARMLAIILLILDIILGILSLPAGIITIIIAGVLLWYFFTPSVKAFFGAGSAPQAPPPPPQ